MHVNHLSYNKATYFSGLVTLFCYWVRFVVFFFFSKKACHLFTRYTAISRKVVGQSARDNPERYCGWFLVHCFSKKLGRRAGEAMDICLRVLKESSKSRFDSYSVRNSIYQYSIRNSVLNISHITFRDCRVHIFSDNLSRNSCICYSRFGPLMNYFVSLI